MRKSVIEFAVIITALLLVVPETTEAIPAFARKHGFNCNMCHTSFVKLNDFGQRLRDDGYQLPGQEGLEKNVIEIAPPLSIRTSTGMALTRSKQGGSAVTTNGFNGFGIDLLAAGVLHKNISFLLIYTPRIDEPAADFSGSKGGTNPSQPGALESANIVFSNLAPKALNLRIGRFEPAYHAVSSKRSYYLQQPYEVYGFTTPGNDFVFDDNQTGIEATGHFKTGTHYALGVVNGSGASPDNNRAKDVYLAAHQVFGRGDGQSAGQRIGVFGYLGWAPTYYLGTQPGPLGEGYGRNNKDFRRIGAEVSLNWLTFNLRALFMQGVDDKALYSFAATDDYEYTGGFIELDYAALPNNRLLVSGLFNWVQPPCSDEESRIRAASALARYYLGDWTAVNVALHAEYTHKETGKSQPLKEDVFAVLVDFAF